MSHRAASHAPLLLLLVLVFTGPANLQPGAALGAQETPSTEVVLLGVSHSGMLVAESYQPAMFRAFFERVAPDAVVVERSPEEFARGSHYEFTWEIQDLLVPWARERGVPVHPFDWLPDGDDQRLAFGVDLGEPPAVRPARGFGAFLAFRDSAELERELLHPVSQADREAHGAWVREPAASAARDFPRRLFLYRTFLQAKRIAAAARMHPGGRLLVLVGWMHEEDLRAILAEEPGVELIEPARFAPSAPPDARFLRVEDLAAIATFNLLGVQATTGVLDLEWLGRVVAHLRERRPGPESDLLATRLAVLDASLGPEEAADRYLALRDDPGARRPFTWDGVRDRRRLDSFADPFANLTVAERATVEAARELIRAGKPDRSLRLRRNLEEGLTPLRRAQLAAYWPIWVAAG